MAASITTYSEESDWLLKNLHQSEKGLQSYHGEQYQGYHLKEHKKTILETGVKSYVAFCLGPSIEKANSVLGKHQISLKFCFNRKYGWMETSVEIDYLQISLAKVY